MNRAEWVNWVWTDHQDPEELTEAERFRHGQERVNLPPILRTPHRGGKNPPPPILIPHDCSRTCPDCGQPCIMKWQDFSGFGPCMTETHHIF